MQMSKMKGKKKGNMNLILLKFVSLSKIMYHWR